MLSTSELKTKKPFFLMAGPCVMESEEHCLHMATEIKKICDKLGIFYIFKSSFDKANRTSIKSFRGPGLEKGMAIMQKVKDTLGIPVVTDIHLPEQCEKVGKVCDVLQIPAFLCRQTDLLVAAAKTGRVINIKKGQMCNHVTMKHAAQKVKDSGNSNVMLCERGSMHGEDNLIVDFRNLVLMRGNDALIVQDVTHALQMPNRAGTTLGMRDMIPTIARAAIAVGIDGLFMEVHDKPTEALSDATTQWPLEKLESLLSELLQIAKVTHGKVN